MKDEQSLKCYKEAFKIMREKIKKASFIVKGKAKALYNDLVKASGVPEEEIK